MSEWQPISTYPKFAFLDDDDGPLVLAIYDMSSNEEHQYRIDLCQLSQTIDWKKVWVNSACEHIKTPIYWMTLPDFPAEMAEAENTNQTLDAQ
jgi:hypothetical protein